VIPQSAENSGQTVASAPGPNGITTRDRGHMQWTNASVFDQKAQEKQKAMEQTLLVKRRERDVRQKDKVIRHVYGAATTVNPSPQNGASREIVIADLRFRVASDGSKLIRILGEDDHHGCAQTGLKTVDGVGQNAQQTPKQHKIAGVLFVRSKHGNLLRSGLVKKQRYQARLVFSGSALIELNHRDNTKRKSSKLCPSFTSTGTIKSTTRRPDYQRRTSGLLALTTFVGGPRRHSLTP